MATNAIGFGNNLKQVKQLSDDWVKDYNSFHPHQSLKGDSPIGYLHAVESGKLPTHKTAAEFTTFNSSSNNNSNNEK